ncbi:MAG: hypothetical protein JWN70_2505 [Planctomycetaceae bacterium]|nr:hypothetical protein [Planctomycetaceae bacterium]
MGHTNLAGVILIVGGAAFTGALLGWEVGPIRLEMSQDQSSTMAAAAGGILALVGCAFAMERSEANARSQAAFLRLKRTLFRSLEVPDSSVPHLQPVAMNSTLASRSAADTRPLTGWTGSQTCR